MKEREMLNAYETALESIAGFGAFNEGICVCMMSPCSHQIAYDVLEKYRGKIR